MAGGITTRAAQAALNYMTGRSLDLTPTPQSLTLALLTSAPPANPRIQELRESTSTGYFRQTVPFSAATNSGSGQPARIENSGNVLFGPFTASTGLDFPVTHCALLGVGAPAVTGNLLSANTSGSETSTANWATLANCTQTRSTTQFKSGAASMAVQATAAGEMRVRSTEFFPVQVDHTYRASYFVYTSVASTPVAIDIEWYDAAGVLLTTSTGVTTTAPANTWVEASRTPPVRAPAIAKAKLVLRLTALNASQVIYCDDMSLIDQRSDEILMTWQFDVAGQAAQNESLQISAGALSMSLG
ncbi:hypothetical protein [Streptomyces atratus]|uniref:hypothetical protein n=1 Tax=Streptomyces atratus TaxID=1893 RepID=UPI00364E459E